MSNTPTSAKMVAEPRLAPQPLEEVSAASPIAISSDEDEPPQKKLPSYPAVMTSPWEIAMFGDLLMDAPAPPAPSQRYQLPQPRPMPQMPPPPHVPQPTQVPQPPQPTHVGQLGTDPGPVDPKAIPALIADNISTGLEYFKELRENQALTIDPMMRKLLQDPLPGVEKPHKVITVHDITTDLYKWFYIVMLRTNKIFSIAYIWYDLCKFPSSMTVPAF